MLSVQFDMSQYAHLHEMDEINTVTTSATRLEKVAAAEKGDKHFQGDKIFNLLPNISCILLLLGLSVAFFVTLETKLSNLENVVKIEVEKSEQNIKAHNIQVEARLNAKLGRFGNSIRNLNTLIISTKSGVNKKTLELKENIEKMEENLIKETTNARDSISQSLVNTTTIMISRVDMMRSEMTNVEFKIETTSSKVLDHIEEKAVMAINQTLGSHEILAMILGNTSRIAQNEIVESINLSTEHITVVQRDVDETSKSVRKLTEDLEIIKTKLNGIRGTQIRMETTKNQVFVREELQNIQETTKNIKNNINEALSHLSNVTSRTDQTEKTILTKLDEVLQTVEETSIILTELASQRNNTCPEFWTKASDSSSTVCIKHFTERKSFAEAQVKIYNYWHQFLLNSCFLNLLLFAFTVE